MDANPPTQRCSLCHRPSIKFVYGFPVCGGYRIGKVGNLGETRNPTYPADPADQKCEDIVLLRNSRKYGDIDGHHTG